MSELTGSVIVSAIILSVLEYEINNKSCKNNLTGDPSTLENFLAFNCNAGDTYNKYLADIDELMNECAAITDNKEFARTREAVSVFVNILLDGIAETSENSCEMKWRAMMISDYAHRGNNNRFRAEIEQLIFRELVGVRLCKKEYTRYASGECSEQEYSAAVNMAREKIIELAREWNGDLCGDAVMMLINLCIMPCVNTNTNTLESERKNVNLFSTNQKSSNNISGEDSCRIPPFLEIGSVQLVNTPFEKMYISLELIDTKRGKSKELTYRLGYVLRHNNPITLKRMTFISDTGFKVRIGLNDNLNYENTLENVVKSCNIPGVFTFNNLYVQMRFEQSAKNCIMLFTLKSNGTLVFEGIIPKPTRKSKKKSRAKPLNLSVQSKSGTQTGKYARVPAQPLKKTRNEKKKKEKKKKKTQRVKIYSGSVYHITNSPRHGSY